MSGRELTDLIAEIENGQAALERLDSYSRTVLARDTAALSRNETAALAVATTLENYYTAAETVLLRISQQFGNNLSPERWHSDLLHRMSMQIPDTRPAVLAPESHSLMDELMRFRHFKRYYHHTQYDWARLDHLLDVRSRLHPMLTGQFAEFASFVRSLLSDCDGTA